jgi:hypothetical protein
MTRREDRGRDVRVGLSAVWRHVGLLVPVVAALILPACSTEGSPGSVHADPARTSSVMVTSDRKVPIPEPSRDRSSRTTPKTRFPRR